MDRPLRMAILKFLPLTHINEHRTAGLLPAGLGSGHFSNPAFRISRKLIKTLSHRRASHNPTQIATRNTKRHEEIKWSTISLFELFSVFFVLSWPHSSW